MHSKEAGFSLYEVLVTLTLIAILAGIAIPSFAGMAARTRIAVEIDALFHAIHLARKESIMRRQVVSICPSIDGNVCGERDDWQTGWIMFNNRDRDSPPQRDPGEPLLRVHFVADRVMITANRGTFTLRSTQKRATNGTFVVCDRLDRALPKALVISYTGRPRVTTRTTRGTPYHCAD